MKYAKTKYVGFVDSDDWVEKQMFEKLHFSIVSTNADIACCGFSKCYENKKRVIELQQYSNGHVLNRIEAYSAIFNRRDVFQYIWNKLYKIELFDNVVFPTKNFIGEDFLQQSS